ncbi:MinD/ParA family protein [Paenibacillus macerans]|uniref:MinD/ParA family ATP-binding protein n=1 Tax=Paenibacillus macerans TaxID=44252 RepID=UPI000EDC0542|nr:hypothetical protein [Paenibacillus macerans]GBK61852.1 hypothetical protein PbDSM24746_18560 [Paenibacillus macerans]GBK68159.1 hypothetical protein PbJCM17693_18670 [Paenibacillus macerans]
MKRWVFIGKSDKRDLLLYLSSALTAAGRSVLLADATEGGKYRYSIGEVQQLLPVTEFCGFDVAAGPLDMRLLHNAADGNDGKGVKDYDYELVDLEALHAASPDIFASADELVLVTSFDRYEVESTARWLRGLVNMRPELRGMRVRPVFTRTVDSYLSTDYILGFMDDIGIQWHEEEIIIPWNELNQAVQLENEHGRRLAMSRLSRSYKRALRRLLSGLAGFEAGAAKRALRRAERRRA